MYAVRKRAVPEIQKIMLCIGILTLLTCGSFAWLGHNSIPHYNEGKVITENP